METNNKHELTEAEKFVVIIDCYNYGVDLENLNLKNKTAEKVAEKWKRSTNHIKKIFYHYKRAISQNTDVNEIFKSNKKGRVGRKSNLDENLINAIKNELRLKMETLLIVKWNWTYEIQAQIRNDGVIKNIINKFGLSFQITVQLDNASTHVGLGTLEKLNKLLQKKWI